MRNNGPKKNPPRRGEVRLKGSESNPKPMLLPDLAMVVRPAPSESSSESRATKSVEPP